MINEDGTPVTTTDNAGQGLTKPELPMKSALKKVKAIIRRKKPVEVPPKVL